MHTCYEKGPSFLVKIKTNSDFMFPTKWINWAEEHFGIVHKMTFPQFVLFEKRLEKNVIIWISSTSSFSSVKVLLHGKVFQLVNYSQWNSMLLRLARISQSGADSDWKALCDSVRLMGNKVRKKMDTQNLNIFFYNIRVRLLSRYFVWSTCTDKHWEELVTTREFRFIIPNNPEKLYDSQNYNS